ncbi:catalase-like [Bicyclus anynana]|uniref:Catalase-like n=1 Tax=Bicyclus anynana TaxID=110368 RepID=A0ABM3LHM8_BICAN|nr:catalase-like [Bicyclus anynana]
MLQILEFTIFLVSTVFAFENQNSSLGNYDPATDQIVFFKERYAGPVGVTTTSSGAPVSYSDATVSLNTLLMDNEFLMERLSHLNRERIPERVVHAKGGGAFGYFQVTRDITHICKAEMFSKIGKKTPVAVRFSSVLSEKGGSDLTRDARGFAIKFYTQEGNFDIVGLNTPMFVSKDPLRFPNFVHALKKNPSTNLRDLKTLWDFLTLNPEGLHMFLLVFGDRGIPANYANMPGFSIHTYPVENKRGELHFLNFHIIPDEGIKSLTSEQARNISDLDYHNRILYRNIANGKFPSWTIYVQVLTMDDVKNAPYDVFDTTKVIPLDKHPLQEVGKLVLDRNPKNFFADVEQIGFCPGNLVPGIYGEPTKLFQARRVFYRDALFYRLGANFNKIGVNCPYRTETLTYNRDGAPPAKDNEKDIPNYYPNSFNGPVPYMNLYNPKVMDVIENPEPNNFDQASELYINQMTSGERSRLIANIVCSLKQSIPLTQKRAVELFYKIHPDLSTRVAQGLKANETCTLSP